MAKELAKIVQELTEKIMSELKTFRDAVERNLRTEERAVLGELEQMKHSMSFISKSLDDTNRRFDATLSEDSILKKENETLRQQAR